MLLIMKFKRVIMVEVKKFEFKELLLLDITIPEIFINIISFNPQNLGSIIISFEKYEEVEAEGCYITNSKP